MEFLSYKDALNVPTMIYEKNSKDLFMTVSNQIYLTKQIYMLHKHNHGRLGYLYFKTVVPKKMMQWINAMLIPQKSLSTDILYYLNKVFVKDASNLYTFKTSDNIDLVVDRNVYKNPISLSSYDDNTNTIITDVKQPNHLLASDYGLIDVWQPQTTEVTNAAFRYRNAIPVWKSGMNVRHYDRNNDGLRAPIARSSIDTFVSGYGSAYQSIIDMKDEQYKKNLVPPLELQDIPDKSEEYFI